MYGMILAAGRGSRMGELTEKMPKPLIKLHGHFLIEYSLHSLMRAGIKNIVINVCHHAEQIKDNIGHGERYGVRISYSEEKERLETGGGIVNALPLLKADSFIVVSSDIVTDYPMEGLLKKPRSLAHLVMVKNPNFHPEGDFGLRGCYADMLASPKYTFANVALYSKTFFANCEITHFPLKELLFPAIEKHQITGEYYQGLWHNIGSLQDLSNASADFQCSSLFVNSNSN